MSTFSGLVRAGGRSTVGAITATGGGCVEATEARTEDATEARTEDATEARTEEATEARTEIEVAATAHARSRWRRLARRGTGKQRPSEGCETGIDARCHQSGLLTLWKSGESGPRIHARCAAKEHRKMVREAARGFLARGKHRDPRVESCCQSSLKECYSTRGFCRQIENVRNMPLSLSVELWNYLHVPSLVVECRRKLKLSLLDINYA